MSRIRAALIAGIAYAALVAFPASAQTVCGDHKEIADRLAADHSESRVGIGLEKDGGVIEIFASRRGSWTILVTFPDGQTCVVGSGEAWEATTTPVGGPTA